MNKIIISILTVALLVFVASLAAIEIENSRVVPADNNPAAGNQQPAPQPTCFVGGCSGQLCSDQLGAVSTCEYKQEYACYKTATCERQPNGQCGWTQTVELTSCLMGK